MIIRGVTLSGVGFVIDQQPIVTSNLQLYLDAANTTSYPGTGTTWYDLSGNSNNVTMQNSGSITYSSTGGGYFSTGSNGYFNKSSTTNIPTGNTSYTLSAWVQWGTSWPGAGGIIGIGNGYGTSNAVNAFRSIGSPNGLNNYWWGNDLSGTSSLSPANQWFNAVATYDGTTRRIYVNGSQITSGATTGHNVTSSYLTIGLTWPTQNEYLQGNIGQALIYDRALTTAEIAQNYAATRVRYGV